jgi:hypothetical protein
MVGAFLEGVIPAVCLPLAFVATFHFFARLVGES